MEIVIATRKSILAQVQADKVGKLLEEKRNLDYKKLLIVTEGDRRLDVSLNKIGGKGLFVKEIEYSLIRLEADCAVHSMKDVPYALSNEFEIIAIPEREDIRDCFISADGTHFNDLKEGATVGTSSIRRASFLKMMRPDLNIVPIRGNVQTRLEKMKKEEMDGIILAAAGLKRLGMEDIITDYFDPKVFLPAIGQGALGIECLKESKYRDEFKALDCKNSRITVEAERSFMTALNGDCHSLIGAYSEIIDDELYMIGAYEVDGEIIRKEIKGKIEDNKELGVKLAEKILNH
ncbi:MULTISPECIES: hydroxymethylbilane synthase [Clostridium]|uniref:Porphobilinogen deaminase n=1 Tax=Clostridium disporicum TaxID=84024 RepID=A0A174HF69_9CLOT|nr:MULTISPECIES: hydroxymethylbilane synthase [Clostridium]MCD2502170.1 hydroxymethylbilane synthase [Clostridium sp. NSJ-145]CUO73523.1 porphobilinogen deaminase [Clostridium disporicum]